MQKIIFAVVVALGLIVSCSSSPTVSLASKSSRRPSITGIVDEFYKCGGLGTFVQLRISDCEGRCSLYPTHTYHIEGDYFPSQAIASLTLAVDLVYMGSPIRIMEIVLPNSSVQPGNLYTVRFSVTPNDQLQGVAKFRSILFRSSDRLLETCVETEVDMLPYP